MSIHNGIAYPFEVVGQLNSWWTLVSYPLISGVSRCFEYDTDRVDFIPSTTGQSCQITVDPDTVVAFSAAFGEAITVHLVERRTYGDDEPIECRLHLGPDVSATVLGCDQHGTMLALHRV